ncbi:MAG: class I SAM-dependent methyltransferase [Anaerolineae bacterium]
MDEMASAETLFGTEAATHYESWYETPEGRRADRLEKAALQWLLEHFPKARSVLEVGCGTGHFTRWLNELGMSAVGLDLSAPMLGEAQALDSPTLIRGDALRLPFAADAFDLVVLVTTLEFLERPEEALTEALRVARSGLLLGVLNRWSVLGFWRRLLGCLRTTIYDAARFYSVRQLERCLRSVAQGRGSILWRTTLYPRWWPCDGANQPWGGFIAIALRVEKAR